MAHTSAAIEVDRALTVEEVALVRWLLEHGEADNAAYLQQLKLARVRRLCSCGCASIDFSVAGQVPPKGGMDVRSDFQWRSAAGHLNGAFVFAQGGILAGLDLWSIDGGETPDTLPPTEALVPYGSPHA